MAGEQDSQQPFDMRQLVAALMQGKNGGGLSSFANPMLAYMSGSYQPTRKLSEGELFEMYAPEFFYIMENEQPGSWKLDAASSISQGVPAYVVKDNLRQKLLTDPNSFGMSTSSEVDSFVDGLAGSYSKVRSKLIEQTEELDPFEKQGFPSASQRYSDDDIFRMGAEGFQQIAGGVSTRDTSYGRSLKGLQERYRKEKAALPKDAETVVAGAAGVSAPRVGPGSRELEEQYNAALTAAKEGRSFEYKGRTYSGKQIFDQLFPMMQEEIAAEKAAEKSVKDSRKAEMEDERNEGLRLRQQYPVYYGQVTRLKKKLDEDFKRFSSGQISESEYQAGLAQLRDAENALSAIVQRQEELTDSRRGRTQSSTEAGSKVEGAKSAPAGRRLTPQETLDYKYKRMAEMASRKQGGQLHAEGSAQAYFNKLSGDLEASGRSPLMDALLNAAILKRTMGG